MNLRHPEGTGRLKVKRLIIGLIVILVLCLLVPISLAKSSPEPGQTLIATSEIGNVTQFNNQRKLVRLSDGTLYAVYEKQLQVDSGTTTGGSNTTLEDSSKSWPAEEFVHDRVEFTIATTPYRRMVTSNTATELTFAALPPGVTVPSGITYKIWREISQVYVKKSTDNGANWIHETRISTNSGMADYDQRYSSIAVDNNDNLHVVWSGAATGYTTFDQLWYAKYINSESSWSIPVRISTYSGMETRSAQSGASIAVDSVDNENNLHVVWYGCATGYTPHQQIWYAKCTTTSWTEPVRISTYPGMENYLQAFPSIAVDGSNCLHVVWYGEATGYRLYKQIWYARCTTSWTEPVRISTQSNTHQRAPSIAVDSSDYLHVVWFGYVGDYAQIWYAKHTMSWAAPVRISTHSGMDDYSQFNPSIAVDINNNLHVVWDGCATAGYYKVWYAKYTDSWGTPECLQPTGQNKAPNARWSRYPSSNQVTDQLDYVFTGGTGFTEDGLIPVNICLGQEG